MATIVAPVTPTTSTVREGEPHPIRALILSRVALGLITFVAVSIIIFWATEVLPGNAASAILGHDATPTRLHALELQMGLDKGIYSQYWTWISGVFTGKLGVSLASGLPVWSTVSPRLVDSAVLVALAGAIGTVIGVALGAYAALRKDKLLDHVFSVVALAVTSLPEFVIAIILIILFATVVSHLLPAVSLLPPGTYPWNSPKDMVLPVATLVIVIVPYLYRMMRAAMIEALESDYVEMARLKGLSQWRIVLVHALPNAVAPTIQVIGLNFLYLAGGIVIVENVFNYPGIGTGLVNAVSSRDIPVIQLIVIILAGFYVFVNILTDVIALLASPRRRLPR
ncbi:MAG TPA: ABC transporter permease [Acidimicrobiales bacterium]|nr:ABC transporter permease [Acidimicrobiales bacterium]